MNGFAKTGDTSYTYDDGGHLRTTTYPGGEVVAISYNTVGQPTNVSGIALVTLSGAIGASAQVVGWSSQERPAIQARDIRGSGDWKTDGRAKRASQRWSLDLERDGNAISGQVALSDSPLCEYGNVEGKISGNRISGAITDDSGRAVASLNGRITESGMSGRYRDRTGEGGQWEWEGSVPERRVECSGLSDARASLGRSFLP